PGAVAEQPVGLADGGREIDGEGAVETGGKAEVARQLVGEHRLGDGEDGRILEPPHGRGRRAGVDERKLPPHSPGGRASTTDISPTISPALSRAISRSWRPSRTAKRPSRRMNSASTGTPWWIS